MSSSTFTYEGYTVVFPQAATVQSLQRAVRQEQLSLSNRLRSIYNDWNFLLTLLPCYPCFPVLANLRCGAWYVRLSTYPSHPSLPSTCYFKSSDSHAPYWTFSVQRCNPRVLEIVAAHEGVMIVDSTRMGKRQPDSFSRTIPIWCCVVNRAVRRVRAECAKEDMGHTEEMKETRDGRKDAVEEEWDDDLHTPSWVSASEKQQILEHIDEWVHSFLRSGLDLLHLSSILRRPLRPLWVDRATPLPNPSQHLALPFYPLILINPSPPTSPLTPRHGWSYVQGAGDDDANWSRGLTPALFWRHAEELIGLGGLECEERVDELVKEERERGGERVGVGVEYEVRGTGLVMRWTDTPPADEAGEGRPTLYLQTVHNRAQASAMNRDRRKDTNAQPISPSSSSPAHPFTLILPVSGLIKDRRALLDILTPSIAFILHHRHHHPSVLITGNDWGAMTTAVIGAVLRGWNERWEWMGEKSEGVMEGRVSKELIRQVSLLVHACVKDVFMTRLQLKQLNEYFLSPS